MEYNNENNKFVVFDNIKRKALSLAFQDRKNKDLLYHYEINGHNLGYLFDKHNVNDDFNYKNFRLLVDKKNIISTLNQNTCVKNMYSLTISINGHKNGVISKGTRASKVEKLEDVRLYCTNKKYKIKANENNLFALRNICISVYFKNNKEREYFIKNIKDFFTLCPECNFISNNRRSVDLWWCMDTMSMDYKMLFDTFKRLIYEYLQKDLELFFNNKKDLFKAESNELEAVLPGSEGSIVLLSDTKYNYKKLIKVLGIELDSNDVYYKRVFKTSEKRINSLNEYYTYLRKRNDFRITKDFECQFLYIYGSTLKAGGIRKSTLKGILNSFSLKYLQEDNKDFIKIVEDLTNNKKVTRYKNVNIKDILKIQDDEFDEYFKPVSKKEIKTKENEKKKKLHHNAKVQRDEEIYNLYLKGVSKSEISRITKVSRPTIDKIIDAKNNIIEVEEYKLNRRKYVMERKIYAKYQRIRNYNLKELTLLESKEFALDEFNKNEQKIILKYERIREDILINVLIDYDEYNYGCLRNQYIRILEEEIHNNNLPYCHEEICIALSPGKRIS